MASVWEIQVNHFGPVISGLVIGFISIGLGAAFVSSFYRPERPSVTVSFAVGTLVISILTFFAASAGLMGEPSRWIIGIPIIAVSIFGWAKYRPESPFTVGEIRRDWLLTIFAIIILFSIVLLALICMYPVHLWDECNSHVPAALSVIDSGRASFQPEINFNNFPQNVEMLYAWAIAYTPYASTHYVNFLAFLFCLAGLIELGRRSFSLKTGFLAALLAAKSTALHYNTSASFTDIWVTFYIMAAVILIHHALQSNNRRKMWLAGAMLGASMGVKYTGIVASSFLILTVLLLNWIPGNKTKAMKTRDIFVMILLAIVVAAPWYVRNIIWFGNPVFPFTTSIFPSGHGTWGHLASELNVSHGDMLRDYSIGAYMESGRFLRELWLQVTMWVAIPLGIFSWRSSPLVRGITIWTVFSWIFWAILSGGILYYRYYIYLVPLNMVVLAYCLAWVYLKIRESRIGNFGKVIPWLMLAFFMFRLVTTVWGWIPPITKSERERFLRQENGSYELIMEANDVIPEDENTIGIICEDGRLFADFTLFGGGDTGYANHRIISEHSESAEELADLMRTRYDADYIIINNERLFDWEKPVLDEFRQLLGSPEWDAYFEKVAVTEMGYVWKLRDESTGNVD